MKAELLSSSCIYQGKLLNLRLDELRLENNQKVKREIVEHPGSVAAVPVTKEDQLILIKQFRPAVAEVLWEIPAGTLKTQESPETAVLRELKEEIGAEGGKLEKLAEYYASPGFLKEKLYLYLYRDFKPGTSQPKAGEDISIHRMTFPQALKLIKAGQIKDAKTIIGILLAKAKL